MLSSQMSHLPSNVIGDIDLKNSIISECSEFTLEKDNINNTKFATFIYMFNWKQTSERRSVLTSITNLKSV